MGRQGADRGLADPARSGPGRLIPVPGAVEDLLRDLAPQVLGTLARRYGQFDACEDATQEALLRAALRWPEDGVPDNPRGWLLTVASRCLFDEFRSDGSRRRREEAFTTATPESELLGRPADADPVQDRDDSLTLLFLCCHPALSVPSQIALTLRAVGGLTTAQIASAFLVPETTMAQRVSRAKATIKADAIAFAMPDAAERIPAVLHVLYLIFNEGYTSSVGEDLTAPQLSDEAIRLTRWLTALLPEDCEAAGLLALMLLSDARRAARTTPDGGLIPLAEQDRTLWNRAKIEEGVALVSATLPRGRVGPYQLQAAIAAIHDEAGDLAATDWPQILALYELLEQVAPNPMVTLNRAVAVAMVEGPEAGLKLLTSLEGDARVARGHRLAATRAHLRELAGDSAGAAADFMAAARKTSSAPERRYLVTRSERAAGREAADRGAAGRSAAD